MNGGWSLKNLKSVPYHHETTPVRTLKTAMNHFSIWQQCGNHRKKHFKLTFM